MTAEEAPSGGYDVVLLVEQGLSIQDAAQVHSLHEDIDEVRYHVLIPVEDSANRIETGLGGLATGDIMVSPALMMSEEDVAEIRKEIIAECRADVDSSVKALQADGAQASGDMVSIDPIQALANKVAEVDAREAIVLTRPHVVSEFFHLDWTSRARRKLGVPVLHLLEHETFDEQSGEGEGVTGF